MKTFENAKVGDKVWYVAKGWGKIKLVDGYNCQYPIIVAFNNNTESFTFEGKNWISDEYPTLFWEEQKLDHNTKRKVEIDWLKVPMNTPVIVGNDYYKRFFLCYLPNATYSFVCFSDENNQFNAKGTCSWSDCKIDPCVEIKEEWLKQ